MYFRCRRCDARLTNEVERLVVPAQDAPSEQVTAADGEEIVLVGWTRFESEFSWGASPNGAFLLNSMYRNTANLVEVGEEIGCCGPPGMTGPNVACTHCCHLVGTASSECYLPHFLLLHAQYVVKAETE